MAINIKTGSSFVDSILAADPRKGYSKGPQKKVKPSQGKKAKQGRAQQAGEA